MVNEIKISIAQIRYYENFEKNNVAKIKKYINIAKKAGSEIVCFPETCIHKTDYLSFNNELVKEIQKTCKKNCIWAIVSDSFLINKKPTN
jgi:predicted amidohydrolase